jgi:protein-tyrosine phosphatase
MYLEIQWINFRIIMISLLNIFSIPINSKGKIAIVSRPKGNEFLDESIEYLRQANVDIVVSALTNEEEEELGLTLEGEFCNKYGIEFLKFPMQDRGIPLSISDIDKFCRNLALKVQDGFSIGIHCRAGIGRSSMLASSIMAHLGFNAKDALSLISQSRRTKVPDTEMQEAWINEYYAHVSHKP